KDPRQGRDTAIGRSKKLTLNREPPMSALATHARDHGARAWFTLVSKFSLWRRGTNHTHRNCHASLSVRTTHGCRWGRPCHDGFRLHRHKRSDRRAHVCRGAGAQTKQVVMPRRAARRCSSCAVNGRCITEIERELAVISAANVACPTE